MAETAEASSADQLTFKVKTSGDKSHMVTISETATVLDLKTKLAGEAFENVPVERQRLIYSGRVLKNDDALSAYKIKSGNTVHMVKSAASNPTPASPTASAPTPQAIPHNMAAGTAANNLLAGLTGARYAGHANLPSRDMFGADGGMGAPPSEDQMVEMLSNPMIQQTLNEALSNPQVVDQMIQSNPMLSQMPNAREMLQSPYFRSMMTNPEALRMAAQMRRQMAGGEAAFPAPGATDTTPAGAPSSGEAASAASFGLPFGGTAGENPFAALLGGGPWPAPQPRAGATGTATASNPSATPSTDGSASDNTAASTQAHAGANSAQVNPFAALFGGLPGQGGQGANAANPFPMSPEAMQQAMQMLGMGGFGGMGTAPAPVDNRPAEERYAEQLRQLNDMGFYDFERNVAALRRSGGSVQGAVEHLLSQP